MIKDKYGSDTIVTFYWSFIDYNGHNALLNSTREIILLNIIGLFVGYCSAIVYLLILSFVSKFYVENVFYSNIFHQNSQTDLIPSDVNFQSIETRLK